MGKSIKNLSVYEKCEKYIKELNEGRKYTNDGILKLDTKNRPLILNDNEIKYRKGFVAGVKDTSVYYTGYADNTTFKLYKERLRQSYLTTIRERIKKGDSRELAKLYADALYNLDIQAVKEGRILDPCLTEVNWYKSN